MVLDAGESQTPRQALSALSELCRIYWRPLYLSAPRRHQRRGCADLTRDFSRTDPVTAPTSAPIARKVASVPFSSAALKHFVADARDREQAQKRGGGKIREPFDEARFRKRKPKSRATNAGGRIEFTNANGQRRCSGRRWLALRRTRFCRQSGLVRSTEVPSFARSRRSGSLRGVVGAGAAAGRDVAQRVERLRARYGEILREEVGGTVSEPSEVDEELRYLCHALTSG